MNGKRRTYKDEDPEKVLRFLRSYFTYDAVNGGFLVAVQRHNNANKVGSKVGAQHYLGYVTVLIGKRKIAEHALVWLWHTGSRPKNEIDHRDGIRNRNLIENLRDVERIANRRNLSKYSNNSSGTTGVYKLPKYSKWKAHVRTDGKLTHLGTFNSPAEAQEARARWIAARPELGFTERHGT